MTFDALRSTILRLVKINPTFWHNLSKQNDNHAIKISYLYADAQIDSITRIMDALNCGSYDFNKLVSNLPIRDRETIINPTGFMHEKIEKYKTYGYDYLILTVSIEFIKPKSEDILLGFKQLPITTNSLSPSTYRLIYYNDPYNELLDLARYIDATKLCGNCMKENCKKICPECEMVYYCSDECKTADYQQHQFICNLENEI
jgi:hypothetical protein